MLKYKHCTKMYAKCQILRILRGNKMTIIRTREFGNVGVLTQGEKYPKGIVIRENHEGVVLEEYFNEKGVAPDVLHIFESGISFDSKSDIYFCIAEARLYEQNLEIPVYIVANQTHIYDDGDAINNNKVECLRCMPEWNRRYDWNLSPRLEKCDKCLKKKINQ